MIKVTSKGDFSKTFKYFRKISRSSTIEEKRKILDFYGKKGVDALSSATPVDSGTTASSWNYKIIQNGENFNLVFSNSNVNKHVNIAVILQYGHATRNGGWVVGRDYINPAIQPIFDEIVERVWKEVSEV